MNKFTNATDGEGLVESVATQGLNLNKVFGTNYLFGFTGEPETRKVLNAPDGARVKIRARKGEFVMAFVMTKERIQWGYLHVAEGGLIFVPRCENRIIALGAGNCGTQSAWRVLKMRIKISWRRLMYRIKKSLQPHP